MTPRHPLTQPQFSSRTTLFRRGSPETYLPRSTLPRVTDLLDNRATASSQASGGGHQLSPAHPGASRTSPQRSIDPLLSQGVSYRHFVAPGAPPLPTNQPGMIPQIRGDHGSGVPSMSSLQFSPGTGLPPASRDSGRHKGSLGRYTLELPSAPVSDRCD